MKSSAINSAPHHSSMNYLKPLAALAIALFALIQLFSGGPIKRPPGELAPHAPTQTLLDNAPSITNGDFQLQPRARYDIEARVLSVERYLVDGGASLSPIDFAVGWGPMSDTATLDHFKVTQGARFFTIYPDEHALDIPTALRSSANMHLIPANHAVRETLLSTRPGNVVTLSGYLVSASRSDGFTWNSSLTREDSGNGACELMYVESVKRR
jgi:hypothetical protein